MKVLCLTQDINSIGGIGNYFRCLYPKFTQDVDYLINGTRLSQTGLFKNTYRFFQDYIRFYKSVYRYDLVQINTSLRIKSLFRDMVFLLICRISRTKRIVFIHGWDWTVANTLEALAPGLIRFALLKSDAVIVLALQFERAVRRWGYTGPLYRLSTFVDENEMAGIHEQYIRQKAKDRMHILFMARLEKEKGIFAALDAVKRLRQTHVSVQLDIAGIGSQLQPAKEWAKAQGIPAVFHGFVQGTDKIDLLRQADVMLLPTVYGEGMPTTILEGMAFGCPVITCPVGGISDFFQDGKMGFLCEQPDPQKISTLLKTLADDQELRIRIGLFNFNYVKQHFTADQVLARLESIFVKVAEN